MIVEAYETARIRLKASEEDAEEFVGFVEKIVNGAVLVSKPDHIFLVQITNRFDPKWVGFSGEALGTLGVWQRESTIPPFHPNRVISQKSFSFDEQTGCITDMLDAPTLHVRQDSWKNLNRFIQRLYPNAAFFWLSTGSRKNGKGSLMSYLPTEEDHWLWYLDFDTDPLRVVKYVEIGKRDVNHFLTIGTNG